jgi:hypothetical protein
MKAAEKGSGLTPAERKAERAPAAGAGGSRQVSVQLAPSSGASSRAAVANARAA